MFRKPREAKVSLQEAFDLHYDDSSDEEDVEQKLSTYDITEQWKNKKTLIEYKTDKKDILHNDELLSFVAHVAGIKLLYSTKTNHIYYPLKKIMLNEKKENPSEKLIHLINTALTITANQSLEVLLKFLARADKKKSSLLDKTEILSEFTEKTERTITENLPHFIQWLKIKKLSEDDTIPEAIHLFQQEILQIMITIIQNALSLRKSLSDRKIIQTTLLELAFTAVNHLSTELEFHKKEKSAGKQAALDALKDFPSPYPHVTQLVRRLLRNTHSRGYVHSMIIKELKKAEKELILAYIEDLVNKKTKLTLSEAVIYKEYFSVNEESMEEQLKHHFMSFQKKNLDNAMNQFRRPILNRTHVFTSNHPYQFYANLRLANRSQRRLMANLQHGLFKRVDHTSSRIWRFNSDEQGDVHETQVITRYSLGRKDRVDDLGNYETVYKEIEKIRECIKEVSDKHIAQWIRQIFQGTKPDLNIEKTQQVEILQKLHAITYLLLGCEASRNPSMHIINQMLLDLIMETEEWSFEEAFLGKKESKEIATEKKQMPMAPEGSVPIARSLTSHYREHLPYPYFYRGIEEKSAGTMQSLIKQEAQIVRAWIKLKCGALPELSKNNIPAWLLNQIENHFSFLISAITVKLEIITTTNGNKRL